MNKVFASMRMGAPLGLPTVNPRAPRSWGFPRDSSTGLAIVFITLFWSIFYQNLPWSLDGFAHSGGTVTTFNIGDRVIKVCMILMGLYAIASRWALTLSLVKHFNIGAAVFLLAAIASTLWSADPAATVLRFISLMAIFLTCFAISLAAWHRQRFQQLALTPLMLILVASLVIGVIYPDRIAEIGTDISQRNAWHGITHGKNEFGMMSSMAAIICANGWLAREGRTRWAILGTITSFVCLLLSRSNTSLLATLLAVGFMALVMRVPAIRQRHSTLVVVSIAALIVLYELVIQNVIPGVNTLLAPIMGLTGKDTTFSARTVIWTIIKEHMRGAPYLGTGYGAYWTGAIPTSPSYIFLPLMYFYPSEAHNGYLDVMNDLGYLGLLCLLLFLGWFIRQGLQVMAVDRSQAALYLALLFQEMVINMSESDIFSRTSTFAVLVLATTCMSRELLEVRRGGTLGAPRARSRA
jgi:exopolysaccharide production protein ExoQ